MEPRVFDESRIDFSHRDVTGIPEDVIDSCRTVSWLDVSHNRISNYQFIYWASNLETLVLDHNLVTSHTVFPRLPNLKTLWINYNKIESLSPLIGHLKNSFPNLKHLSMMGNEVTPPCTEDTFYDYLKYRLMVIAQLTSLEYLDDRPISQDEKEEAQRLFTETGEPRPANFLPFNISDFVVSIVNKVHAFIDTSSEQETSPPVSGRAGVI